MNDVVEVFKRVGIECVGNSCTIMPKEESKAESNDEQKEEEPKDDESNNDSDSDNTSV